MTLAAPTPAAPAVPPPHGARYIVSPLFDLPLLVLSPLLALLLAQALFATPLASAEVRLPTWNERFAQPFALFLIAVFTHAHLVLVFLRSHANRSIYHLHPLRFRVVPLALLGLILTFHWAFVAVGVLVVWWDVYHSSLQTFGIGRIYDARAGNPPERGRRVDQALNLAFYVGPILAGANLFEHAKHFAAFEQVGSPKLASLAQLLLARQDDLRPMVFAAGLATLALAVGWYWREHRAGRYRMPLPKLLLLLNTGVVSIVAWGTLSVGEAFFTMNFFHALQYFAIVWVTERKTVVSLLGLGSLPMQQVLVWLVLLVPALAYGLWATVQPGMAIGVVAVSHVVSILHFWYDGFIWSVRAKQV